MVLLEIFHKRSRVFYSVLITLSIVNGLLATGILIIINNEITGISLAYLPKYGWLIFLSIITASFFSTKVFQTYMIRLSNDILFDFELNLLDKLKNSTFESYERLGKERVFTAMTDIKTLANIPEIFTKGLNAIIVVICCFFYLFVISIAGGIVIFTVIFLLLAFYIVRNRSVEKSLNIYRDLCNLFYKYLNDLLHGFKEIKVSRIRTDIIFSNFLKNNSLKRKQIVIGTSIKYLSNELMGRYTWYIILAIILFLLPITFDFDKNQVSAFIMTILFLMSPVVILINLAPNYTNVKIAVERLNDFNVEAEGSLETKGLEFLEKDWRFESIQFRDIEFQYFNESKNSSFKLGPINISIQRGEVVFLTGGNGSGKSTFIGLLMGLYKPVSGSIYVNGNLLTKELYVLFRDRLSAIFSDNYLFTENYNGFDFDKLNRPLSKYIDLMNLADVLNLSRTNDFINHNYSKGQQKRLALILALLECKQIMVLDEWAAEQDKEFKSFFYKQLIPRLVKMGKTVIAVTHDDKYYQYADRVIKFDFGKIVEETTNLQTVDKSK